MFIITNYKIFERYEEEFKSTTQFDYMDRWSIIMKDIMSKSDYIKKEFDIEIRDRNKQIKSKQYLPYIDLYKADYDEDYFKPVGVYRDIISFREISVNWIPGVYILFCDDVNTRPDKKKL